tara:strand:- start:113 stop:604 length:492 start_codon:yes stop_codon:yes gene_type:complete
MILQYFKSKENKYKKISNNIYIFTINKSKDLIKSDFFREVTFETSFELTSLLLIFQLKVFKNKKNEKFKEINEFLIQNFITDLDNTFREMGIGDMSIGKYVKKYVKKFYYRLKILDPYISDINEDNLTTYFNSIKFTKGNNVSEFVKDLRAAFSDVEKNIELI